MLNTVLVQIRTDVCRSDPGSNITDHNGMYSFALVKKYQGNEMGLKPLSQENYLQGLLPF